MSELLEWLAERKRVHASAEDITEGKWFACRYDVGAGNDPGDPDEIVGRLNAKDYATAVADAHNSLPQLLAGMMAVLELHGPERSYFGDGEYGESEWCGHCRDEGGDLAAYPCQTVQEILSSIQSVS